MVCVNQILNSPIDSNCFVIWDKVVGNKCIIVDPGSKDNTSLYHLFENEGLTPFYIILTHEHFDHCWGVNELVKLYHVPIICSQLCTEAIKNEKQNCSVFYDNKEGFTIECKTINIESINGLLKFGENVIHFFNTPGQDGKKQLQ